MKKFQVILLLIFGILSVFLEFRNIREDAIFGLSILEGFPLLMLCVLTVVSIYRNFVHFRQTGSFLSFLPALLGIVLVAVIFVHIRWRSSVDNSPSLFTATNHDIGSDGGFILDFKANNYLKAEKRDHWLVTYYWGRYKKQDDTFLLNIPLDFKMGRQAILQDDVLTVTDDTLQFDVYRQ